MQNSKLKPHRPSALWLALLFFAGSGLLAQARSVPPNDESREAEVRALYTEAARNLQAAGHDIALEVHHVATIPPEQFDRYKTYEMFSMGEGICLYVEPHTHGTNLQMPDGSQTEIDRFITFHLEWRPDYWLLNAGPERAELFQSLRTQSFADYMETAAQDDESLAAVEAVTSFEVHLSFEGRSRVYRGMVVWFPEGSAERQYALVDQIVLQLDTTLKPELPIRPEEDLKKPVEIPKDLKDELTAVQGRSSVP